MCHREDGGAFAKESKSDESSSSDSEEEKLDAVYLRRLSRLGYADVRRRQRPVVAGKHVAHVFAGAGVDGAPHFRVGRVMRVDTNESTLMVGPYHSPNAGVRALKGCHYRPILSEGGQPASLVKVPLADVLDTFELTATGLIPAASRKCVLSAVESIRQIVDTEDDAPVRVCQPEEPDDEGEVLAAAEVGEWVLSAARAGVNARPRMPEPVSDDSPPSVPHAAAESGRPSPPPHEAVVDPPPPAGELARYHITSQDGGMCKTDDVHDPMHEFVIGPEREGETRKELAAWAA